MRKILFSKSGLGRAAALLLSSAMVVSLAGCGETDGKDTTAATTQAVTEQSTQEQTTESTVDTTESTKETEKEETTTEKATESTEEPTPAVDFDYEANYVLKDIYADDFLVGTIWNGHNSNDKRITEQFNALTAENQMKPDAIHVSEGTYNTATAKKILEFADANNLKMHNHVLIWHQQTPRFLATGKTREEALEQMKDHIYTTMKEVYSDDVISWDVVNEAIDDGAKLGADGDYKKCLRNSQWKNAIGEDYLEYAFQYASEAADLYGLDVKLYYNDYNLDDQNKAKIVVAMVKELQKKGIRIDGVGMQGHYSTNTSVSSVVSSIDMFRSLGVSISVSELDVGCSSAVAGSLSKENQILQAQKYAQLFQVYKANSDIIERVTFWGHMDASSWRSENAPCLYDKKGNPKESFYAVADPDGYLAAYPASDHNDTREATASQGTPTIDGEIDSVWDNAIGYTVNKQLTAWQGATGTCKMLWDDEYLYVLVEVKDSLLNASNSAEYLQDSVELYLDQQNDKTGFYGTDDGQYRVSYKNKVSFGNVPDNADEFQSATKETADGYLVEAAIPLKVMPYDGREMGFECQINDANASGERQAIAKFCDSTDNSYASTENWGTLKLMK